MGRTLLALLLAGILHGQTAATGAISGVILDAAGAAVPHAAITVTAPSLRRSVAADEDGEFHVPLLTPGEYVVTVHAPGFAESVNPATVRVTETTRLNLALTLADRHDTIEVAVNVTDPATGHSLEARSIAQLPLATQNVQQLLTLSPGAVSNLNTSANLGRGDVRMEVNGQREDDNNYLIEGISASDSNIGQLTNTPLPSPDVVQEFRIQTSLYDATQGRNSGGNINAILKSGGDQLHGSLFEHFRNEALNANEYFYKTSELTAGRENQRPVVKQNIFGGSLGGPLGKKAALGYFFVNYQGTRQRSGLSPGTYVSNVIPVLPADRSAASLSSAFFGNPNVALDPVSVRLLNLKGNLFGGGAGGWLIPSLNPIDARDPGRGALLTTSNPGRFRDDQFTTNYDRELRKGVDRVAARFFFTNFRSYLPFGAGGLQSGFGGAPATSDLNFPFDLPVHDRFLSFAETHVFSQRLVNEFRFGFVRIANDLVNPDFVTASQLGIERPDNNLDDLIYKFSFPSYQIGPTPQANQYQRQNNLSFLDTASFTAGRHVLRFGGEYDRVALYKEFPNLFNAQVFFGPSAATGSGPCAAGCTDFQNFLLGAPFFSWGGSGVADHRYRIDDYALFLQDDFRVGPRLTLNFGLRWELTGAPRDELFHIGNTQASLALEGQSPFLYPEGVNQYHVPGWTGTTSATTMLNDYASNWGPRAGFAWSPFAGDRTSIRGGFGMYYVREDIGRLDQMSFSAPFLPVTFPAGNPGSLATLFATGAGRLPAGGVIDPAFVPVASHFLGFVDASGRRTSDTTQTPAFDGTAIGLFGLEAPRHYQVPNTQQWNLTVQQAIGEWRFEAAYVGNHGLHLRETRDPIQPYLASPQNPVRITASDGASYTITQNTIANANARSRVLGMAPSGYQLFANDAWSHYHSAQLAVSRRAGRRLEMQASYTFSKALDATSSGNTAFNTALNDQTNLRDSYGLADFDRRHRAVGHFTYQLPKGWSLSGIVTFQSGTPFTVIDSAGGSVYSLSSPNTTTPNLAQGFTAGSAYTTGGIHERLGGYLKAAAFAPAPVVGVDGSTGFGNLGRNLFRGPFEQNWDLSAAKTIVVREHVRARLSADLFNVWNHPVFNSPSIVDIESPTFGAITTTAGTPRLIQLAARVEF